MPSPTAAMNAPAPGPSVSAPITGAQPSFISGPGPAPVAPRVQSGLFETIGESLFGDVYAPEAWRPLRFDTFLSEGWLEPWAGAPAGRDGLTPRHGWLGALEGVFYRLWLTPVTYQNNLSKPFGGESYGASFSLFLPLSRRFELFFNVPYVTSNGTDSPTQGYRHDFGDLVVTPRFLLQEDEATTQTFNLEIRTPTGVTATGGNTTALTPRYEFWTNPGGAWVVRGAAGFFVPLDTNDTPGITVMRPGPLSGIVKSTNETSFVGGLAVGRYFTPHDVPFGDLVFYAASNLVVPLDGGSANTYIGVGPGTRFHITNNYFFLNYLEFPVVGNKPYDYLMSFAILKVF